MSVSDKRLAVRVPDATRASRDPIFPHTRAEHAHPLANRYPLAGLSGRPSFLLRTLPYVFGVRVTFCATTTGSPANGGNFQRMAVF
jgi:hypothetical protein